MSPRRTTHSRMLSPRRAEHLPGVVERQLGVGRHHVAAVAHRVAVLLLPEDLVRFEDAARWRSRGSGSGIRIALVDHAIAGVGHAAAFGSARIAARTQAVASRLSRRNSRRSSDIGPWFVTTVRSSFQSGSA